jgi:hypothetical protein
LDSTHLCDDIYYEHADLPDLRHHEAGTTASEFDGALDDAEDEDKGMEDIGVVDDKSDEEASATKPKHRKNAKKVCNELLPLQASSEEIFYCSLQNVTWHVGLR